MKIDLNDCQRSAEYYQEKFAQVWAELMDRIGKYKELSKKYTEVESQLTEIAKEESKRKCVEVVEVAKAK